MLLERDITRWVENMKLQIKTFALETKRQTTEKQNTNKKKWIRKLDLNRAARDN